MIGNTFRKFTKWNVLKTLIFKEIDDLIIRSFGIVAFISFFVGGVVAIQTALNIENPLLPGNLVGFATRQSVILEFAPTFISIIMAGKVGSFITSSIGTMRVTEQIDALETLSFDPVSFLIMPRVLSGAIMFPVMIVIADLFGIMGGYFAATVSLGISPYDYVYGLRDWFVPWDAIFGVIKAFSFGLAITSIACYFGFYTVGGAEGVGKSTTQTVVVSCITIVILDYLLAALLL
mgnify:CR=1 FL=1